VAISNIDLRVNSQQAVRGLRQAQGASQQLTKSVGGLRQAFGFLTGGLLIAGGVRNYFKGFNEAEQARTAVRTLGVDVENLSNRLLLLSTSLEGAYSQTELLAASYDVASAGFIDAAEASQVLEASALGAVGGMSDLGTVSDAVTSVLNAYGLEADKANKIVDGFIQTQNDGKIIVDQYARQIGRIAPTAKSAGISIDELNAAISTVTAQGVPVEQTFTGLNQAIVSILKPTGEAEKIAKKLGIEFNAAALQAKGFGGILEQIAASGATTDQLAKLFGSVEAMKAVFPLINDDLVKFNQNLENQANSSGTALKATEEFQGTLSFQFSQIVKNVGNLARGLDEVLGPAFKGILGTVNDIVSRMNEAVALMRVFPAYQELGKAGADITFGMESKGMERLIAGVGMAETSLAGATNLKDLEAVSTLINKIRNQATRVNSKRQEDNLIELLNAIDTIRENIKLRELEIIEAQTKESSNNDEINDQIKTKSSLLDEIFAKNSVQFDQVAALTKLYTEMSMTIRNGLVDAIEGAINGTRTLGEVASAVFSQIQRSLITYGVNAFLGSLGGGLGRFFGLSGGRSLGGGVMRGSSYMVGERGPEIFTPSSSGRISTGGATNVVVNVDASGSAVQGDEDRGKQLGLVLSAAIQAELVNQKRPGGLLA
jgi:TP901 family phage tail tape measure protein